MSVVLRKTTLNPGYQTMRRPLLWMTQSHMNVMRRGNGHSRKPSGDGPLIAVRTRPFWARAAADGQRTSDRFIIASNPGEGPTGDRQTAAEVHQ
jgi:hypothetical protein